MAIQLKRSSVAGSVPAGLEPGELAINDAGSTPVIYVTAASGRTFALTGQWTEVAYRILDESGNILTTEAASPLRREE